MSPLRTVVALALWGLVVLVVGAGVGVGATSGQEPNHVSLVIVYPDGETQTLCVEFTEETISGAELLRRSGLSVVFAGSGGLGDAVCQIEDTGCSNPGDCFCQCSGGDCAYWTYFSQDADGEWRFQNVGASSRTLRDGDADAWIWGASHAAPEGLSASVGCGPPSQESGEDEPDPPELSAPAQVQSAAPTVALETDGAEDEGPADIPAASQDEVAATAEAPTDEPALVRAGDVSDDGEGDAAPDEQIDVERDGGDGVPIALIAFGVVMIMLVGGISAFTLRGRFGG